MAGGWERNTRQKIIRLPVLTKPAGGGITSIELPKTGFLSRIYLYIPITITGTLSSPNALGVASVVKRVRVSTNSGIDIFNVSGPGYAYLLRHYQDIETHDVSPKNNGTLAVTAASFRMDMAIPIMLNLHDPVGLLLLQNEQLQVVLTVEWEADTAVATGATVVATAEPTVEFFTVPPDRQDWPPLNIIHQIIEDNIAIAATGDYIYNFQRGNVYLQALAGYGLAPVGVDNWSRAIVRINQSDILYDLNVGAMDALVGYRNGYQRSLGTLPFDFLGSDGLGNYGSARDFINSGLLTDYQLVLSAVSTGTLFIVRRMLLPLGG
jgi:hypothetical protein